MTRTEELKEFLARARKLDMDNDEAFRALIKDSRLALEKGDGDIADMLMVSRTTFNRWINGRTLPHPLARRSVMEKIAEQVNTKLKMRVAYSPAYAGSSGMVAKSG